MTLTAFRSRIKIAIFVILFLLYGTGSYLIGKYVSFDVGKSAYSKIKEDSSNRINSPVDKPEPANDVTVGRVISNSVKLCSNTALGFEIAYPKDWFSTFEGDDSKCLYFAPYSFVIPKDENDKQFVPIKIEVAKSESWAETLKFVSNPNDFFNVITVENIDISSRPAQRVKSVTTGAGSISKNFIKTSYAVFDSKTPLVISYQQTDEKENTNQTDEILKNMVDSLKFY